jgi:hypothetical protein
MFQSLESQVTAEEQPISSEDFAKKQHHHHW